MQGIASMGVVCIENEMHKRSVRISPVTGLDEDADAKLVADLGYKLNFIESKGFFPELVTEENFKFK